MTPPPLRAVSLFSGCGGLDLGVTRAGFALMLGNDNDALAAESHRLNFPEVPFYLGSVADLDRDCIADLAPAALKNVPDLLIGGPPCPPFSKSRFYRKDMPRAFDDPVGWETINGYLDVLRLLRPRAFLLENVPGLAYEVHQEALNHILGAVKAAGYNADWRVLNAADFGVPQIRQRVFIIGLLAGSFTWPEPTHDEHPERGLFTASLHPWVTAGDAIGDLDTPATSGDEGHVAGGKHRGLLAQVPPGENYLYFTAERGHPDPQFRWRSRYWSFLLKLSPTMPSWTIQARRSNNMGPFHWRNRILRIEEVRRLQTFPDEWRLTGTTENQWRQLGNAVPPLLASRLAESIAAALRQTPEVP